MTREQKAEICNLHRAGWRHAALRAQYRLSASQLSDILACGGIHLKSHKKRRFETDGRAARLFGDAPVTHEGWPQLDPDDVREKKLARMTEMLGGHKGPDTRPLGPCAWVLRAGPPSRQGGSGWQL